jgi:hypothetical protein
MIRMKEERRIDGWSFRFCKSSVASRQWSVWSPEGISPKEIVETQYFASI